MLPLRRRAPADLLKRRSSPDQQHVTLVERRGSRRIHQTDGGKHQTRVFGRRRRIAHAGMQVGCPAAAPLGLRIFINYIRVHAVGMSLVAGPKSPALC